MFLTPARRVLLLEVTIDTVQYKVFLSQERQEKILGLVREITQQPQVEMMTMARRLGTLVSQYSKTAPC